MFYTVLCFYHVKQDFLGPYNSESLLSFFFKKKKTLCSYRCMSNNVSGVTILQLLNVSKT